MRAVRLGICVLIFGVVCAGPGAAAPAASPSELPPLDPILALPKYLVPNPNGYAALKELVKQVNETHRVWGDSKGGVYHPAPREAELAAVPAQLADNRTPLSALKRALDMEWLNPDAPAPDMLFPELSKVSYLARLWVQEANLFDQKGQEQAAIGNLLDALKLGVKVPRGGPEFPWLMGRMIESPALKELRRLIANHRLPVEVLTPLPDQLRDLVRQKVPLREIVAMDYECQGPQSLKLSAEEFWKLLGGSPDFVPMLKLPGADAVSRDFIPRFLPKLMSWDAQIAELSAEPYGSARDKVAALTKGTKESYDADVMRPFPSWSLLRQGESQCYWRGTRIMAGLELDRAARGKYAEQLGQVKGMAPEDLVDPFSGKPLVYRPQGDGYVLYSTGPDGKDHGGHRQRQPVVEGSDLMLWPDNPPQP